MALKKFTYTSADDLYVGSPAQITLDSDKYGALPPLAGTITEADDGDPENTYTVCYESDDLPSGVEFIDFCDVSQIDVDNLNCPETYSITTNAGSGGQIQPGNTQVIAGQDALFQFTPDANYEISDVLVDGVSIGTPSSYQFTNVSQNHTIEVQFALVQFLIDLTVGSNGSSTPSSDQLVNFGDDITFNFTPDPTYEIADVLVNGVSVGAVPSYEFTNVSQNNTIEVVFSSMVANAPGDWIRTVDNFLFSSNPLAGVYNSFAVSKDGTYVLMYNIGSKLLVMYDLLVAGDITTIDENENSQINMGTSWGAESITITNSGKILMFGNNDRLYEYQFTNGTDLSGGIQQLNDIAPDSLLAPGFNVTVAISIDVDANDKFLLFCRGTGGLTYDTFLLDIDPSGDITTLSNSQRLTVPAPVSSGFPYVGATLLPLNRMLIMDSRGVSSNSLFVYDWQSSGDFTSPSSTTTLFTTLSQDVGSGPTGPPPNWAPTYQGTVQYSSQFDNILYGHTIATASGVNNIFNIKNVTS